MRGRPDLPLEIHTLGCNLQKEYPYPSWRWITVYSHRDGSTILSMVGIGRDTSILQQ